MEQLSPPPDSMELKVISCKDLKAFNFFQKLNIYVVVSIVYDDEKKKKQQQQQKQKTPIDKEGDGNPEWNHLMRFDLKDIFSSSSSSPLLLLLVQFDLLSEGTILGDKTIGRVLVPIEDLIINGGGGGGVSFLSYQVRTTDGIPNGVLDFSFKPIFNHNNTSSFSSSNYHQQQQQQQIGYNGGGGVDNDVPLIYPPPMQPSINYNNNYYYYPAPPHPPPPLNNPESNYYPRIDQFHYNPPPPRPQEEEKEIHYPTPQFHSQPQVNYHHQLPPYYHHHHHPLPQVACYPPTQPLFYPPTHPYARHDDEFGRVGNPNHSVAYDGYPNYWSSTRPIHW